MIKLTRRLFLIALCLTSILNSYSQIYKEPNIQKADPTNDPEYIKWYNACNKADNYLDQGLEKAENEDYVGAIIAYGKALELVGQHISIAYYYRGIAKSNLQDYRGAIADYNMLLSVKGFQPAGIYYYRGIAKAGLKDYTGAISDYNKDIELLPENKDSYIHYPSQRDFLEKKIIPKKAEVYFSRGNAKFALKQKESACLDFSKAGELGEAKAYEQIKKLCTP